MWIQFFFFNIHLLAQIHDWLIRCYRNLMGVFCLDALRHVPLFTREILQVYLLERTRRHFSFVPFAVRDFGLLFLRVCIHVLSNVRFDHPSRVSRARGKLTIRQENRTWLLYRIDPRVISKDKKRECVLEKCKNVDIKKQRWHKRKI